MADDRTPEQLTARLEFVAQENVLHEQLIAITAEIVEGRQRGLSAEQWQAALALLTDLCEAIAQFRTHWRELVGPSSAAVRPSRDASTVRPRC